MYASHAQDLQVASLLHYCAQVNILHGPGTVREFFARPRRELYKIHNTLSGYASGGTLPTGQLHDKSTGCSL